MRNYNYILPYQSGLHIPCFAGGLAGLANTSGLDPKSLSTNLIPRHYDNKTAKRAGKSIKTELNSNENSNGSTSEQLMQQLPAVGQVIGTAVDNAKNKQDVTAGGVFSSAATGAAAGSIAGPYGAAAGALVGGLLGGLGHSGSVDDITGQVQNPSGIIGLFTDKNKLRRRGANISNSYYSNQIGQKYAAEQADVQESNDFTLAAYGNPGIKTSLAYLDDGELVRTPDGEISQIPEEGKPTDSNLVAVPEGTQVLSDKLKVPGTKYTFAQMGKKLMKDDEPTSGDRYSENSVKLNKMNNQAKYSELIELQTMLQNRKKLQMPQEDIPHYKDGTTDTSGGSYENWEKYMLPAIKEHIANANASQLEQFVKSWNDYQTEHARLQDKYGTTVTRNAKDVGALQKLFNDTGLNKVIWDNNGVFKGAANAVTGDTREKNGVDNTWGGWTNYIRNLGISQKALDTLQEPLAARNITGSLGARDHVMLALNNTPAPASKAVQGNVPVPENTVKAPAQKTPSQAVNPKQFTIKRRPDVITALTNAATMGGAIGAYQSIPKPNRYTPPIWTPKYGPTDYNINPQLAEVALSDNIAKYNMAQLNPNTGANMAFGLQSAINRDRQTAALYADKFNKENEMKWKNAGIYNTWAPDITNRFERAADINARRQDNYITQRSKALANIFTTAQGLNKDRVQNNKDWLNFMAVLPTMNEAYTSSWMKTMGDSSHQYNYIASPTKNNNTTTANVDYSLENSLKQRNRTYSPQSNNWYDASKTAPQIKGYNYPSTYDILLNNKYNK